MFAPQKNRAGQRTYRRRDVEMALRIKELLYDEKYTIAGAKQKLSSDMRGVNRENGVSARPKAPSRSLQPPPSLAAKFGSLQSAENVVEEPKPNAAPSNDQQKGDPNATPQVKPAPAPPSPRAAEPKRVETPVPQPAVAGNGGSTVGNGAAGASGDGAAESYTGSPTS